MRRGDDMTMTNFRIMRKIEIDAAHRIPDHGSMCRYIHGHRYVIEAHCVGPLVPVGEQKGMVLDFKFLKEGLIRYIHDPCDHGAILFYNDPILATLLVPDFVMEVGVDHQSYERFNSGLKLYLINCVPTAENLARHWYNRMCSFVKERSEGGAFLENIRVYETPNCYADFPIGEEGSI